MTDAERAAAVMSSAARDAESAAHRMGEHVREAKGVAERIDFDLRQFEYRLSIAIADFEEKLAAVKAALG